MKKGAATTFLTQGLPHIHKDYIDRGLNFVKLLEFLTFFSAMKTSCDSIDLKDNRIDIVEERNLFFNPRPLDIT